MNVLQQELDEYRRTPDGRVIQGASHTSCVLSHKYRNKIIMETYSYLKKLDINMMVLLVVVLVVCSSSHR